jgi:hypothetical protein
MTKKNILFLKTYRRKNKNAFFLKTECFKEKIEIEKNMKIYLAIERKDEEENLIFSAEELG